MRKSLLPVLFILFAFANFHAQRPGLEIINPAPGRQPASPGTAPATKTGTGAGFGTGSGSGTRRATGPATTRRYAESYYLDAHGLGWENVFVRDENNNYAGKAGGFTVNQIPHLTYSPRNSYFERRSPGYEPDSVGMT